MQHDENYCTITLGVSTISGRVQRLLLDADELFKNSFVMEEIDVERPEWEGLPQEPGIWFCHVLVQDSYKEYEPVMYANFKVLSSRLDYHWKQDVATLHEG